MQVRNFLFLGTQTGREFPLNVRIELPVFYLENARFSKKYTQPPLATK